MIMPMNLQRKETIFAWLRTKMETIDGTLCFEAMTYSITNPLRNGQKIKISNKSQMITVQSAKKNSRRKFEILIPNLH